MKLKILHIKKKFYNLLNISTEENIFTLWYTVKKDSLYSKKFVLFYANMIFLTTIRIENI